MATKKSSSKGGAAKSGKKGASGGGGKGGGGAKGSAKSAKKAAKKAAVKVAAKGGGSKGLAKVAAKASAKGSAKGSVKSPAKSVAKSPAKGAVAKGSAKGAVAKGAVKGSSKGGGGGLGSTAAWTGIPTTINPQQNATMSQTPNGTIIFAYQNSSTTANAGKLSLSSGGTGQLLDAPALTNQPQLLIKNFKGSNLSVSNISQTAATPILIEAVGPGIAGLTPTALPMDGTIVPLVPFGTPKATNVAAQGNAPSQSVVVSLQANSGQLTIFAIQVGNNAMVIALNAAQESGPGSDSPDTAPPAGYFATTTGNNYQNMWNWGASAVFVVNMSPSTAAAGSINLIKA